MPVNFGFLEEIVKAPGAAMDVVGVALSYLDMDERALVSRYIQDRHPNDENWAAIEAGMYDAPTVDVPAIREMERAFVDGEFDWEQGGTRLQALEREAEEALRATAGDEPPQPADPFDWPDAAGPDDAGRPADPADIPDANPGEGMREGL